MRFTKTIASATVAAVLGLAGASVAGAVSNPGSPMPTTAAATTAATTGATSSTAKAPTFAQKKANARLARAARRAIRRKAAALIAKTIGITPAALRAEIKSGKTIAQVATEHGVQPQTVITALENAADARIKAAVTAGKITAKRGARLETRVAKLAPKIVNTWHPKVQAPAGPSPSPTTTTTAPAA